MCRLSCRKDEPTELQKYEKNRIKNSSEGGRRKVEELKVESEKKRGKSE
jgi:hypothetical protein